MSETSFIETEALLLAMMDADADSGNTDALDAYLREQFLPGELRKLSIAAELLSERCWEIRREKRCEETASALGDAEPKEPQQ